MAKDIKAKPEKAAESVAAAPEAATPAKAGESLRPPAELLFAHELAALAKADTAPRPVGWKLSPKAVETYLLGGKAGAVTITPKYIGSPRLVQIAISSLATDRALLLVGEPGTAKSWLSEHLTAAICGDSLLLVQGTAGTTEEQIRYSWNYAMLLAEGPSPRALVPSPVYRAMEHGGIVRFEELSRAPAEVQDVLITILSEKVMAVPELGIHVHAKRGFSLIGTANTRDRGVNDMSAALKRRFNIVTLPVPDDLEQEIGIVMKRVGEIGTQLQLPSPPPAEIAVARVVQIFQEMRKGQTLDGKQKVKASSNVLSTAECISMLSGSMALAGHFGSGTVDDRDIAASLHGAMVKEDPKDLVAWTEYLENVVKKRGADWQELYKACRTLLPGAAGK